MRKEGPEDATPVDELVDRARAGDVSAFEALMRVHYGRVLGVTRGICGRDSDAEDAAQDTFVRAWRALPGFRGDSAFSTWLYRIATNVSLTLVTRRREAATDVIPEQPTVADAPEERMLDAERLTVVRRTLDGLSPDARAAFVLRELEGLTYDEIAEALDITLSAVKSRIFRARQAIADALRDHDRVGGAP